MTYDEYVNNHKQWQGTLVLNTYQYTVGLLKGFVNDEPDVDFSWIIKNPDGTTHHCSAVIRFTPLKGFIQEDHYNELVRVWNLNDEDKAI